MQGNELKGNAVQGLLCLRHPTPGMCRRIISNDMSLKSNYFNYFPNKPGFYACLPAYVINFLPLSTCFPPSLSLSLLLSSTFKLWKCPLSCIHSISGLYLTQDYAYCDADGDYQIQGRKDEIIRIKGVWLQVPEIESRIVSDTSMKNIFQKCMGM